MKKFLKILATVAAIVLVVSVVNRFITIRYEKQSPRSHHHLGGILWQDSLVTCWGWPSQNGNAVMMLQAKSFEKFSCPLGYGASFTVPFEVMGNCIGGHSLSGTMVGTLATGFRGCSL